MCNSYGNKRKRKKARSRASKNKPVLYAERDRTYSLMHAAMISQLVGSPAWLLLQDFHEPGRSMMVSRQG